MSKNTFYRQCRLVKKTTRGERQKTSWLPEKFAVLGKALRLRQGEEWEDGWVVTMVSESRLEDEELPGSHREIKNHRKATGDSSRRPK
jgi:hypothetical protein